MRATEQKWAERVEGWRESGLTSEQYSDGRDFSANGLRHWAYRLGKTKRRRSREPVPQVRIVRVVRGTAETMAVEEVPLAAVPTATPTTTPTPASAAPPGAGRRVRAGSTPAPPLSPSLDIEIGPIRVAVRPGFDRATLVAVLDVLAAHGGSR